MYFMYAEHGPGKRLARWMDGWMNCWERLGDLPLWLISSGLSFVPSGQTLHWAVIFEPAVNGVIRVSRCIIHQEDVTIGGASDINCSGPANVAGHVVGSKVDDRIGLGRVANTRPRSLILSIDVKIGDYLMGGAASSQTKDGESFEGKQHSC